MKKSILLLFLCLMTLGVKAQDVSVQNFFLPRLDFFAEQFDGQCYFILDVAGEHKYNLIQDTEMRLQFFDGTEAKWKGQLVLCAPYAMESNTEERQINNFIRFDVTPEMMQQLQKGIKLLTINTVPLVCRYEFKKDQIGRKLYDKFQDCKTWY